MTTRLDEIREDIAAQVETILGVTCRPLVTGNPEANIAMFRWGSDGGPWLERADEEYGTFCTWIARASIVCTASSIDYRGAQELLAVRAATLAATLGGQALARGGVCPQAETISEPGTLFEDLNLLAIEVGLVPIPINL